MAIDLTAIAAKVRDHVEDALAAGGQVILDRSQELVPLEGRPDTHGGTLAESGRVNRTGSDYLPVVSVTYDGPYAIYQHEGMEFHHPTGGSAKFLERAMVEKTDAAIEKMGDEIGKALGT
jgi:hypothetical protein